MKKLILLACLFATPLYAGLFEDTEARKKLQEMQLKETELESRIVSLEAVIKSGSLNDMLNQIELIKQDVSKLRGDICRSATQCQPHDWQPTADMPYVYWQCPNVVG